MNEQKIIIVGGGNVGLSFALLLAKQGIKSTLLEKSTYPTINPDDDTDRTHYLDTRNMALSRRTVQIYQQIGLWDELQSHACRIDTVKISEQDNFGKATLNKHEENVESFGQVIENNWLGRKLLLAVQANPLIELFDGTSVTDITQSAKNVTIFFTKQGEKEQSLTADLLVACDGQNSICRQLLGIKADFYDYEQMGIVGTVMTDQPHNHEAIERFSPTGLMAVLPLTDSTDKDGTHYRRSVVWVCKKGEEQQYLDNDEFFLQTLQKTFGERAGKFVKVGKRGAYPLVKVLAQRQVAGRCVIMGNSAHTLHPVAGQGFNLCMRDADTLAKMITQQVMRGENVGENAMLKTYEKRRKADQKRVILFCDTVVYGFTHRNPLVKVARNVGLIAFDKVPFVKPMVATFAMGLKS